MPDGLRIVMLSVHSCPMGKLGARDTGGMSVYIRELARELGRLGHSVDVYTRVHDQRDRQVYELGDNARLIHLKVGEHEPIDKLSVYPLLPDFVRELEGFRQSHRLQYDVIYSHYWLSGLVGRQLGSRWGVPDLVMFHTLGAVKNALGIGEKEPGLRIDNERQLANSCRRVIAATEREKEDIIRYYGVPSERVSVIPCGVNLELFRPMDRTAARQQLGFDSKTVLFVGRIEPLKGIDRLLEAMSYVQNGGCPRLVVVGGDGDSRDDMERLRRLARELHITDSVDFVGRVGQEELPLFYNAADMCVVPSYYESFGLVTLESLACGTPVVAARVGVAESVVNPGKTGYLVSDDDPRHLAGKIQMLLHRPAAPAADIRASVAGFGWSGVARAVEMEFRSLLADYSSIPASFCATACSSRP
ncbi:MAG: glycosyltransferase [Chloroflexota bacterium]